MAEQMEVTGAQLAEIMGFSRARITQLKTEGVLVRLANRRYALAPSVRAVIGYIKRGQAQAKVGNARARFLAQQERRLRFQNDEREGRLFAIEDYDAATMEALAILRAGAVALPGRAARVLAQMTEPAEIKRYLGDEVTRFLNDCADKLEAFGRDGGGAPA